jgi:hypothetical protein
MQDTTKARDKVAELSASQPKEALRLARQIADPWFAVQALAWIVRRADSAIAGEALGEARDTAKAGRDAYQRASVLAWPIRAAVETGRIEEARRMLADGLALIPKVKPAGSRAEAAGLLLEAAFPAGPDVWRPALEAIEAHCAGDGDWRSGRLCRSVAHLLAHEHMADARRLVAAMPEGKIKDRAAKELGEGVTAEPRPFF